jgi:undecaprenyl-diphosphatase
MPLDSALLAAIVQLRTPWLDEVMLGASSMAQGGFLWLVLGAIGSIFPARRAAAWRLALAIALTFVVVDVVLKPAFDRSRPFEIVSGLQLMGAFPTGASFPSGHAARACAGAIAGGRLFPALRWVLWPAAALVAVSRVYLGVHWPADVAAGAAIGLACGWFVLGGRKPTTVV